MGIKNLNRYLLTNCSETSISKKPLSEFSNKVVVIDTSIYLYKFVETGTLIEGIYNMISILRKYHIIPLFVFDGKPPIEKRELLQKRRIEKNDAEEKYNEIKRQLDSVGDVIEKHKEAELQIEMEALKKRFVRITHADIQIAKDIIVAYGINYIESLGESDQLCAFLVKKSYAWACISDDMDMFVYGCPRVIRHISLLNHTGILYDTGSILNDLNMTYSLFCDIMVLSGTDYNISDSTNLTETIKWYDEFVKTNEDISFYDWLDKHTKYINDKNHLEKTRSMFDLFDFPVLHQDEIRNIICKMPFRNGQIQQTNLHDILKNDGFIFL